MRTITGQTLAGTLLDRQGERNSKEVLERYASAHTGKRIPLHQHHDLALPVLGYVENMRVVADEENPGDWRLIGDVSLNCDDEDPQFGGFSFSYIEKLRSSVQQECIEIFLPYPHYNDGSLIDDLFEEGFVSVGRVVRKEASPELIAIAVSVAVAIVQPLWEDLYRSKIAPPIERFFREKFNRLSNRNIGCDFIQHIDLNGHDAKVHFVAIRGKEEVCLSVGNLCSGMMLVADYLNALDVNHVPASKLILTFDQRENRFVLHSVQFADGTVIPGG